MAAHTMAIMDAFSTKSKNPIVSETALESDPLTPLEDTEQNVHHLRRTLTTQIHDMILSNWDFPTPQAESSYLSQDLTGVACQCFPFALDDRIHLIARLFSVVYLLGQMIADLDMDDAEECLESLQEAVRGYWQPDREQAAVWMLCDLFDEIRGHEYQLVDDIIDATWRFLGLRTMQRGRRVQRNRRMQTFQESFMASGMLLLLHRLATGVMVDEDEFNFGMKEQYLQDLDACSIEPMRGIHV